jgi:hypothetical protein
LQIAKSLELLAYAPRHKHSQILISAILTILLRRGGIHA